MTPLQKLQVRQSELRQRVNDLLGKETLDDKESSELETSTRELQGIEPKLRAALVAQEDASTAEDKGDETEARDDDPDAETRELQEISGRATLSSFAAAALNQRNVDGAERELAQAFQLPADAGHIPLIMLVDPEQRQDAVSDFNAADAPVSSGRFLARVFTTSIARWLGITFESVPVGERVHTVLTGGVDPDTVARAATQDADAATLSTIIMDPHRITARYLFELEDVARLPQLEARLRQDLSMALANEMDSQIFNGNAQLTSNGLSNALAAGQTETVATFSTATAEDLHADVLSAIDGVYATMLEDVRLAMDSSSLVAFKKLVNADVEMFLYDILKMQGLSMNSSNHIAAGQLADGDKWAYASKRRGLAGAAVAAVWPSLQLVRDPYTAAAKGQVALTIVQMWDFALIRAANFRRFVATAK